MPDSPLIAAGAQSGPVAAAPLHTNRIFTGMWTQRSPLRDAATTFLNEKYYSATRFDSMIDGANTEITTRLTLARRPGSIIYNSHHFPPINRFYEFRTLEGPGEAIHVLASVDNSSPISSLSLIIATIQAVSVQIIFGAHPAYTTVVTVTFTLPVPEEVSGQTYTFSGLTHYPAINAHAITPGFSASTPGPNQVIFAFPGGPLQSLTLETGTADVGPVPTAGATVRDVTGPSTNLILWNKAPNAGRTSFVSVGNVCYWGDGVDTNKWVLSKDVWAPLTTYQAGAFIVDENNNIQKAVGPQLMPITNIQVQANVCTIFFTPLSPLDAPLGVSLYLTGLTTIPALNTTTQIIIAMPNSQQASFSFTHANVAFSVETGQASTGSGTTGATEPVWSTTPGAITLDSFAQWECMGSSVQNWGFPAPANAPTVTQTLAPTLYPSWAANTWYAPLFVILASPNLYQLTTGGITGSSIPAFTPVIGATTTDGSCVWTCLGTSVWSPATHYNALQCIQATYTYWITVSQSVYDSAREVWVYEEVQQAVTATSLFQALNAGTTAVWTGGQPNWPNGLNTTIQDGEVTWINRGTAPGWPGATQTLSLAPTVIGNTLHIESPQQMGETGTTEPVWTASAGSYTPDNAQLWLDGGPYAKANTAPWVYAYSGKNSITAHIGTASPLSNPITVSAGMLPVIQGQGLADPQIDELVLWRTVQGGTTLLYLDTIQNPGAGVTWIYTDTTPDAGLNELITAPIAHSNDAPPSNFVPQCYYLGRIWGFVLNVLQWTGGPDTITGSGNESFPPLNQFTFPSLGVTCWPTSIGLVVFTNSDIWLLLGNGTANSPFYAINFQAGVGLGGQDAFTVNGSTGYGMLTSGQVVSMDPGAGELEIGFPIGDQFDEFYIPSDTYLAWHQGASKDMALYVADGLTGWFRMSAVAAPESGNVWSPRAIIEGGVKAILSVEIEPGVKRLLLGPSQYNTPILMREDSSNEDDGTPYPAFATIGSIVLAQPGTTVGLQFITVEEKPFNSSSPCGVGVLLDEVEGDFITLVNRSNDPPNQPPSKTINTNRWWCMQSAEPIICRHAQIRLGWPAEDFPNELLTYTLYGRLPEKGRK